MKLIISIILLFSSSSVFSQEPTQYKLSVGGGAVIKKNMRANNLYDGMDKNFFIKPIPVIIGSIGPVSLGPQGLSYRAFGNRMMNVSAFFNRGGERYQGLTMGPRKESIFFGLAGKFLNYSFNVSRDINGRSKGYVAGFSYGKFSKLTEEIMLRSSFSLDWHDDRYAEYYYGVRKSEEIPARREFHVTNFFQPGISVSPIYAINQDASLFTAFSLKLLPKKVTSSPTMNGDRVEFSSIVGFSYNIY